MAITLTYSPYEISSAYRKLKFSVSSDATATDLKIRAKVEYSRDAVNYTSLGNLYGNKNISNGEFEFDFSNRLKSTLTHDYFEPTPALSELKEDTPYSIVAYKVTFTEQYANNIGLQDDFDTLNTNVFYACNAVYLHEESQSIHEFIIEPLTGGTVTHIAKFLTLSPLNKSIRKGEIEQLSFLSNWDGSTSISAKIRSVKGNASGVHNLPITSLTARRGTIVVNFDNYYSGTANYLEVWIEDANSNILTEVRRFTRETLEGRSYYRICWLNKKGGFDYYTFIGTDSENVAISKIESNQYLPDSYTRADSRTSVFSSEEQTTISAFSLWEGLDERRWLKGLFSSPKVWLIDRTTHERISIKILNKSYQTKEDRRLLQVPVQFEFEKEKIR